MSAAAPRVAFHATMKPPEAPTPSGDRRIARLTLAALEAAGFAPFTASALRLTDMQGDPAAQARIAALAEAEAARLIAALRPDPPALWLTYHCYWKAPDLIGPRVAAALKLPYVITEPSWARRRREGAWAGFARAAEAAFDAADLLLWSTRRDLPGMQALLGEDPRLQELAPFIDLGPRPAPKAAGAGPLRLLSVAMMRPGDKMESYARLADALSRSETDWRLEIIGDGKARTACEALFAPLAPRVAFRGAVSDPCALRAALEAVDLLVWPGVNEGFGMVYLEAMAAGTPVLAEAHPGPSAILPPGFLGAPLPPPGDAAAYAAAIDRAAADRAALAEAGSAARDHAEARHGLDAAAARLRALLLPLIERS